mgnify:CR=1 FL=1
MPKTTPCYYEGGVDMDNVCGNCAYAQKEDGEVVWCKFHKEKITENSSCDDFLDFLDTPVMSSLLSEVVKKDTTGISKKGSSVKNHIKDFFAWVLILCFIVAGIVAFLYC